MQCPVHKGSALLQLAPRSHYYSDVLIYFEIDATLSLRSLASGVGHTPASGAHACPAYAHTHSQPQNIKGSDVHQIQRFTTRFKMRLNNIATLFHEFGTPNHAQRVELNSWGLCVHAPGGDEL